MLGRLSLRLRVFLIFAGLTAGLLTVLAAALVVAGRRLDHQARRIRAGLAPDNYLAPSDLPEFERGHLRDAFVVVRTMQSALGHGKGALG